MKTALAAAPSEIMAVLDDAIEALEALSKIGNGDVRGYWREKADKAKDVAAEFNRIARDPEICQQYQCGCGAWMGERCNWTGPASAMVVVEWRPEYFRSSHIAGRYPDNGSLRVAVGKGCADLLMQSEEDRGWARVTTASPEHYAEEAEPRR